MLSAFLLVLAFIAIACLAFYAGIILVIWGIMCMVRGSGPKPSFFSMLLLRKQP